MRKLQYLFTTLSVLCFALPALAAGGSVATDMAPIGVGLGMGLAACGCGIGEGKAVASTAESFARNPRTRAGLLMFMLIGLAFIESLTLFTFAMIIIKVK